MPVAFEQDRSGRYITEGLGHRDFMRVFRAIHQENNTKRRRAQRTLTPGILSRGQRNSVQDLVRLGRKKDGTEFTQEDLARFAKMRKSFKKRAGGHTGVTYLEVAARSAKTRVDRASNRSNDRRGISKAALVAIRVNVATIRVKASAASVHQEHRVRLRARREATSWRPNGRARAGCRLPVIVAITSTATATWPRWATTVWRHPKSSPSRRSPTPN